MNFPNMQVLLTAATFLLGLYPERSIGDSSRCPQTQFVELGQQGIIQCSFNERLLAISWYNEKKGERIILYTDGTKSGEGYESGEFDIEKNGSLIIQNVTTEHDSVFRVTKIITDAQPTVSYSISVHTTVKPSIVRPVINTCTELHRDFCIVSTNISASLRCSFSNSRPAVNLTWVSRSPTGDHTLLSNYNIFTQDNVTYTSAALTHFSFEKTSLLRLLVCKATRFGLKLKDAESMLYLQKHMKYTNRVPPIEIHVKRNSPINLRCVDSSRALLVWTRLHKTSNTSEILYVNTFKTIDSTNLHDKKYRLNTNGSLSFPLATVADEGRYTCIYDYHDDDAGIYMYDVFVVVDPVPYFPVVEGCINQEQYCVLEKDVQDVLTCMVLGIRPEVELQWRTFQQETSITFLQYDKTIKHHGDLYDIILTAEFQIKLPEDKVTLECIVVGENEHFFDLSTKVDLLFQNVLPTDTSIMINAVFVVIVAIVVMILLVTITAVLIVKRRPINNNPNIETEEALPMMTPDRGFSFRQKAFIAFLKTKYQILYDAIQPIPYIKDRMHCVDKVFVEGGIELLVKMSAKNDDDNSQWEELQSYQELLSDKCLKTKRQIIQGGPGYGKSTLALQLLYDWCKSIPTSPIMKVDIVIYLRLRQLGGVKSIFSAVKQFILPKDADMSEEEIKEMLTQTGSVLLLLDGFCEYPDQEDEDSDIVNIFNKKMLQSVDVILTTRSSCLPKLIPPKTARVRLIGFGEKERKEYVRRAVVGENNEADVDKVMARLSNNPILDDLCQVPLFFVMFSHVTHEREEIQNDKSVTSLFRYMISCFHSHTKNKMTGENVKKYYLYEREHKSLDKTAFKALSGEEPNIVWNREDFRFQVGHDLYDHFNQIGVLVEEEVFDNVTLDYKIKVRFYHKLFCEWYAAHHVPEWIVDKEDYSIDTLLKTFHPVDLQYFYRFTCGLNKAASEKVIQYLQRNEGMNHLTVLCMLEQKDKSGKFINTVKQMVSSKIVIGRDDSKLLQRSTVQILEIASIKGIPIDSLELRWSFSQVDKNTITLLSGIVLPTLSTLRKLLINSGQKKPQLTEDEVVGLINYVIQSQEFEKLWFVNCTLPASVRPELITDEAKSRNIRVFWPSDACYLHLESGQFEEANDTEIVTEMCSQAVAIDNETSETSQRRAIRLLKKASERGIPIYAVSLDWSFKEVDKSGNIILHSGRSLPTLTSVKIIKVQAEKGREMSENEVIGILNYAQHSESLKEMQFENCLLPSYIHLNSSQSFLQEKNVEVSWKPYVDNILEYELNFQSGHWLLNNGYDRAHFITENEYSSEVKNFRKRWR